MARRRSTHSTSTATESNSRRKGDAEARAERATWALLVLVFAITQLLPETTALPNFFVPFCGALILLGSGIYQYARHWRVSPTTWIAGALLGFLTYYDLQIHDTNFLGASLLIFFGVIIFGLITGET